jgi:hypothetical protein
MEQLFNEAGPSIGAMEVMVEMLAERIASVEGAGTDPDLMEFKISHNMLTFLEAEGRDIWQDHTYFLGETLTWVRQAPQILHEDSPSETQDTIYTRTALQPEHNMVEIQEGTEGIGCGDGWVVG